MPLVEDGNNEFCADCYTANLPEISTAEAAAAAIAEGEAALDIIAQLQAAAAALIGEEEWV